MSQFVIQIRFTGDQGIPANQFFGGISNASHSPLWENLLERAISYETAEIAADVLSRLPRRGVSGTYSVVDRQEADETASRMPTLREVIDARRVLEVQREAARKLRDDREFQRTVRLISNLDRRIDALLEKQGEEPCRCGWCNEPVTEADTNHGPGKCSRPLGQMERWL